MWDADLKSSGSLLISKRPEPSPTNSRDSRVHMLTDVFPCCHMISLRVMGEDAKRGCLRNIAALNFKGADTLIAGMLWIEINGCGTGRRMCHHFNCFRC